MAIDFQISVVTNNLTKGKVNKVEQNITGFFPFYFFSRTAE